MKIKLIALILFALSHPVKALDLIETYHLAIETDPKLKSSYLNQYSVGESKAQSVAQMLPAISVTGKSSRERLNNKKTTFQGSGVQNYWNHGFTVNFSQPVFHWEHWVQLSQSQNKIAQAESEHQAELQNLIVRTTEAYFNVLA
ncbi:MAG: TolC family protein, partial [Thiotrichaceae bacterium]|nr:TolC family protein [Thiotrichaceae bacterium]